ncbi:MAG: hypothetical protein WBD75_04885 [Phycisphaerae bacterium]
MGILPCIAFSAFAALAVVFVVFAILKARRRREAMARLAKELGFEYYPDDPWNLEDKYAMFELFGRGHSRKASNVICGEIDGRAVVAFDYQYKTGSGKNKSTHSCQAVVMGLPIVAAGLRMRSESLFDRVASWVGYDDIDFESDEFSRRYHVACGDRRFAYDILHARLIDYLLGCGSVPNLEMQGPLMVLFESQGDAANVRRLLETGREIVASIPDYVRSARGIGQPAGDEA